MLIPKGVPVPANILLLICLVYLCILLAVHSLHLHEPTGITLHPTLCYKVQDSLTLKPAGYYATLHLHWILQDKLNPTGWNATVTGLYVELHTLLQAYRCINIGIPFLRICFSSITNRIYDRGSDMTICHWSYLHSGKEKITMYIYCITLNSYIASHYTLHSFIYERNS